MCADMQTRYPHKNIRLDRLRYIGQNSYFITFCCEGRGLVFTDAGAAMRLIENLRATSDIYRFAVYAYCVMPDHFHALLTGLAPTSDLRRFAKNLKQTSSDDHQKRFRSPLWQKKFYDHIFRPTDNFAGAASYIWMNPVRKGLCADPRDYPFSGSFVVDWKTMVRPLEDWTPEWKREPTSLPEKSRTKR